MVTEPDPTPLFDFLCEHSPSKSRVMALIGPYDGPRSLTAVLTCKDKHHAYQAVQLLRRALAARDTAAVAEDLQALASALPHAPASSLHTAATHAASGTWPAPAGTTFCVPDENSEEDEETQGDQAVTSPEPESPFGARLKDLPGKVVRIAHLREFHITDEDALIRAAMDEGWEPLPASELAEDDPRDVIGAVMTLTDSGSWITGADTLEDQSEAELLHAEDGDELADWSPVPVTTHFHHGWQLRRPVSDTPTEEEGPDLTALFPVKECSCEDEDCEDCGWQLTPRTADLLLTSLSVLADQAYDDADDLRDQPLTKQRPGNWELFTRLPALTWSADRSWRRRMARAFDDLSDDLEHGRWPQPSCTAEEMALHLAIEDAPSYLDDIDTRDTAHGHLPEHRDDYDWNACSDLFFQDHDVLMLFDARLDGIEDPDGEVNQRLGMGDLRAAAWFEPFGHPPARDPERGFRR
ncbi:hypothetical protein [Streptomyces sp. NPDC046909]|uniref:hypothetical protein n=1 Tax=Streptomyces sp. NPDC046909 TaxID=3155617 RepID=UPI0033E796CD